MTKKTFLKRSINVEEEYEGAGGEILVDNDGWLATYGKPKDQFSHICSVLKQILFMRRIINLIVMIISVIRTPRLMNLGKKRMVLILCWLQAPVSVSSHMRDISIFIEEPKTLTFTSGEAFDLEKTDDSVESFIAEKDLKKQEEALTENENTIFKENKFFALV
ncbi:hypothetical protein EZV62_027707 [Acer yangbiense]|uniref:Uncharacterized protein n=1 Tax=Acer yangbiense TaxID=1000413 RepID=A0A5C7GUQ1_9ROSI|nr:hypothetical protein EZV62_027707 [Acer yangbiense]